MSLARILRVPLCGPYGALPGFAVRRGLQKKRAALRRNRAGPGGMHRAMA